MPFEPCQISDDGRELEMRGILWIGGTVGLYLAFVHGISWAVAVLIFVAR